MAKASPVRETKSPMAGAIAAFPVETASIIALQILKDKGLAGVTEKEAASKAYLLIANVIATRLSIIGDDDFASLMQDYAEQLPRVPTPEEIEGYNSNTKSPPFIGMNQRGGAPMPFRFAAYHLLQAAGSRNRKELFEQFLKSVEGLPAKYGKSKISFKPYGGIEGIKKKGVPEEIYGQLQLLVADWYEAYRRSVASSNARKRRALSSPNDFEAKVSKSGTSNGGKGSGRGKVTNRSRDARIGSRPPGQKNGKRGALKKNSKKVFDVVEHSVALKSVD